MDAAEPLEGPAAAVAEEAAGNGRAPAEELQWRRDKQGREYIAAQGRKGIVYRKGSETVAQALERDATPTGDKRPRRSKTARKPPAPSKVDLREIDKLLAEALCSPAVICAGFGDAWAADHFTRQGPVLARNLVLAAEHNPWLRKQLETTATAGTLPMQMVTMLGVGGAFVMYLVPPIVYWLNLPVPEKGREMFGIPPRRDIEPTAPPPHASPLAATA